MKFENFHQFTQASLKQKSFQHDIKIKRIRKQLENLQISEKNQVNFIQFNITQIGLQFIFGLSSLQKERFALCVDFQYPFSRPHLFYLHHNHILASCKDLLDSVLDGQKWGPSIMLTSILSKVHELPSIISRVDTAKWSYHISDYYSVMLLKDTGVKIFSVEEYEWKYMIRRTKSKKLGLTNDILLKFEEISPEILKLQFWIQVSSLKEANAVLTNKKFNLQIKYERDGEKGIVYFGGDEEYIDGILQFLNPIEMIERKLTQIGNLGTKEMTIKGYSELIEYYSMKNPKKSQKYIHEMRKLIEAHYNNQNQMNYEKIESIQVQSAKKYNEQEIIQNQEKFEMNKIKVSQNLKQKQKKQTKDENLEQISKINLKQQVQKNQQ